MIFFLSGFSFANIDVITNHRTKRSIRDTWENLKYSSRLQYCITAKRGPAFTKTFKKRSQTGYTKKTYLSKIAFSSFSLTYLYYIQLLSVTFTFLLALRKILCKWVRHCKFDKETYKEYNKRVYFCIKEKWCILNLLQYQINRRCFKKRFTMVEHFETNLIREWLSHYKKYVSAEDWRSKLECSIFLMHFNLSFWKDRSRLMECINSFSSLKCTLRVSSVPTAQVFSAYAILSHPEIKTNSRTHGLMT